MTQTQALPTEAASPNHRFGHAVIAAAALVIAVAIALVTLVLMRARRGCSDRSDRPRRQRAGLPVARRLLRRGGGAHYWDGRRAALGCQFGAGPDAQLGEDVFEVGLDGGTAHEEAFGDLRLLRPSAARATTWCSVGVRLAHPWPRALPFASYVAGVGCGVAPVEVAALGVGAPRRRAEALAR